MQRVEKSRYGPRGDALEHPLFSLDHRDRAPLAAQHRRDLEAKSAVLTHGPSAVVYAVCDRVVDGYLSVMASLEEDVDEVETSVFSPVRTNDSERIYTLKREIAEGR